MNLSYDFNSPFFKVVRTIPGLVTILLLTAPIWATLLGKPQLVLYYIAFLSVYWFYKTIMTSLGNFVGYRRYKRALRLDWDTMIKDIDWKSLPNPEEIPASYKDFHMVILIPYYREHYAVHKETIDAICASTYDLKKVTIVYAVEESGGPEAEEIAKRLQKEYGSKFEDIRYYIHPKGLPGEAVGIAGPNLSWASKQYVKDLLAEGKDLKNYQVLKFDSDGKIHPKLLSNYVHTYLTTPRRYNAFFSPAVFLYANNYWDVPVLIRIFSGVLTLAMLSEWVVNKKVKQSFSCFGFNLKLLHDIDYFDPFIGVDDTGFYWRAFLALDGDFRGEEFYTSCSNDAVQAENYVKSHINQYKQLLRWGWGAIVYPMAIQGMTSSKKMKWTTRLYSFLELFRVYNMYQTIAFLLMFAIPLISFLNPDFGLTGSAHILPQIISVLMTVSLVGLLPSRSILEGLYGAPPKEKGILFFLWHYIEQIGLVVFSLTFGFFPYLQAQIEMMMGKSMNFMVTPKIRKSTVST